MGCLSSSLSGATFLADAVAPMGTCLGIGQPLCMNGSTLSQSTQPMITSGWRALELFRLSLGLTHSSVSTSSAHSMNRWSDNLSRT